MNNNLATKVKLVDINGRVLHSSDIKEIGKIDVEHLVTGVYYLYIQQGNNTVIEKVVIE